MRKAGPLEGGEVRSTWPRNAPSLPGLLNKGGIMMRGSATMLGIFLAAAISCTAAASVSVSRDAPEWSAKYSVDGVLDIPFAEISEPFEAFLDAAAGKSRVDFYGGMDKTYQRADLGFGFKVVPFSDERAENQVGCFVVNGTEENPIEPQSVLPDLKGFQLKGEDVVNGETCEKWQKKEVVGDKVNKYTMWLKMMPSELEPDVRTAVPVMYVMKGFNNLLGSHYDHYYLTYQNFNPDVSDPSVFDDYDKEIKCRDWPGPGKSGDHHVYFLNPLKEFVDSHTAHVDENFEKFKEEHGKEYVNNRDHDMRKDMYRQNLRFIHSKNRAGLSYSLASNHLADWTEGERRSLRGRLYSPNTYNGGQPFQYKQLEVNQAPSSLDWRIYGAVTPVKDQSVCGSCWSFGTVGTLEGARFLRDGIREELSQQALMDCSWGFGNNGCDGGEDFRAYQFMMKHGGLPSADDYGPYLGNDGYCHIEKTKPAFQISGYVNVTSGDLDALKVAMAQHGPISVGIDASHRSFSFYSNGVYYDPECSNKPDGLDHSVLAVGYGEMEGKKYWLVKNSWSTHWGNDGYVLMAQKDNNCGVATSPTYVVPAKK